MPHVILVDENDTQIGVEEKIKAHEKGQLHRAFSIFILRHHESQIETLLHQRDHQKHLGAGLWTNSCCSHPSPGESILDAGSRRLEEEFGFVVPLKEIGVFTYRAEFDNGLIEHEVDHVLIGYFDDTLTIKPDPSEIADYRWVSLLDAKTRYDKNPTLFSPWFSQALALVISYVTQ